MTSSLAVRVSIAAMLAICVPRTSRATPQIATDDSPPADTVLFPTEVSRPRETAPTLATPKRDVLLGGRFTASPAFGMIWLDVNGEAGNGMALQPTLTRTFDRVELQAALSLADWNATSSMRGGLFARMGGSVGYQAGRIRVQRTMTLDLVIDAGAGVQRFEHDEGGTITRPDLSMGLAMRMLSDANDGESTGQSRIFLGMEAAIRVLVMPRAGEPADRGMIVLFGIPLGR